MIVFYPDAYGQKIRMLETKAGTVTVYSNALRRQTPRGDELECRVYALFLRRHRSGGSASQNVREMQLKAPLSPPLTFYDTHRFYILLDFIDVSESLEQLRESVPPFLIGDVMKMGPPLFAQFKTRGLTDILRNQLAEPHLRIPGEETVPPLKTLASLYLCIEFLGEISKFTDRAVYLEKEASPPREQDYVQLYEERVADATPDQLDEMVRNLNNFIRVRNCYETFEAHVQCECLINAPGLSTEGFNTLIQTMAFANYPLKLSEALRSNRIDTISIETQILCRGISNAVTCGRCRAKPRSAPLPS